METNKLRLNSDCITKVPLQTYNNDFTFIVNGEEIKTSRIISDLISPKICRIHSTDPTFERFVINTQHRGDFSLILKLINFDDITFQNEQQEFILEVVEALGNEFLSFSKPIENIKLTKDNIFPLIKKHKKHPTIYSNNLELEIEFISSHFYEFVETNKEELISLGEDLLSKIVNHNKLKLKDEDQILTFVNEIYQQDRRFNILYEFVIFQNTTSKSMNDFVEIFDYNDLTFNTWEGISKRLKLTIEKVEENSQNELNRYYIQNNNDNKFIVNDIIKTFLYQNGNEFNGIIHHLTNKVGQNIVDSDLIKVSTNHGCSSFPPKNVLNFNSNNVFASISGNQRDTWICFDFNSFEILVSNYTIKTGQSPGYVKNWVIEISNDGNNWTTIDEKINYSGLNGSNLVKTFEIKSQNNNFSQFVRFRHTGEYWSCNNCLRINSIEFYGQIKENI